jgi:hypothetical protein
VNHHLELRGLGSSVNRVAGTHATRRHTEPTITEAEIAKPLAYGTSDQWSF